jgi:REP element-mobilizing transposase RayT
MPDHLHGILIWGSDQFDPVDERCDVGPQGVAGWDKDPCASCTKRVNETGRVVETAVWQRNYYAHIVRNQRSLDRLRRSILENPLRWSLRM